MMVIKKSVEFINPGQTPVITADQPLFALLKQAQWTWPNQCGEDKFVIVLGGLHQEMAAYKVLGDWLKDSGWIEALDESKVATPGTAESFLIGSHVSKTRHAHEVTACTLFILMKNAYEEYVESDPQGLIETFDIFKARRMEESPQFHYWAIALELELTVLLFIRSIREGNFNLYVSSLKKLAPWYFALDHPNYARWTAVHINDMEMLHQEHPDVHTEFQNGNFAVQKSTNLFSMLALDHAHEQNNAVVKGDGGAVGLFTNTQALLKWMTSGAEMARIIGEFEASLESGVSGTENTNHHDQTKATQTTFGQHVQQLTTKMEEMGSPFLEHSNDILQLDTKEIANEAAVRSILQAPAIGQKQYNDFVSQRLRSAHIVLTSAIKRNKLALLQCFSTKAKPGKSQITSLKNDCSLFSRLYIACQTREGSLDDFFKHENQSCPPSLSHNGLMRKPAKGDLVECLIKLPSVHSPTVAPPSDVIIVDGAAVVNILKPTVVCKTFEDYSTEVLLPHLKNLLGNNKRMDVVWDDYFKDSLKAAARSQRGTGRRKRVAGQNKLPKIWQQFLRDSENKKELFRYLAEQIFNWNETTDKDVVTTYGNQVLGAESAQLSPCNHEEGDTRMMVHAAHAVQSGHRKVTIRSVDTDVVIVCIAVFPHLELDEMWVYYGVGDNKKYIPIHAICDYLGDEKCSAMPFFHAFTGCDTVSAMHHVGKKKAWDAWNAFDDVTPEFVYLAHQPHDIPHEIMIAIERYTILAYDRSSELTSCKDARMQLYASKGRLMENIPPSFAALQQHTKRAVYQAACWSQSLHPIINLPSPMDWGWCREGQGPWLPYWTTLPEACKACRELLKCGCKKGCKVHMCGCKKAALKCTALCLCGGHCET